MQPVIRNISSHNQMTRGPDKSCLFTDTHPHPFSAQASENVQVSHIFCKSNAIQCGLVAYCLKQPCCKSSCEVNSSPSINISVHIQAFKVWEPHLFKCVCVCVCVCPHVCLRVCVHQHSLWGIKEAMNTNCFLFFLALLRYVAGKRHTVLSKG